MGIAVGEGLWQSEWASDEISGADCHPAQVDLAAGDLLYLPACWWHCVQGCRDRNLILNWWHELHPSKVDGRANAVTS